MYNDSDRIVEFPALKAAQEKLDEKRKGLASVLAEAGADYDMSKVKSLSGDTHAKVAELGKMNAEIIECKTKVDEYLVVARAAAATKRGEGEGTEGGDGAKDDDRDVERKGGRRLSVGDEFIQSRAFKEYKQGSGSGPQVTLKADFTTAAGWDPQDIRTGHLEFLATRPAPTVVQYFPQTTTVQSAVVYMEETTFTNAAAETAEGGTYPESALQLTERNQQVRKVAVFLPVTDEQFEDEPRARDYVNNRLPFMIQQRLDAQVLGGNGSAPNLLGTENVSGINTQALSADSVPDAIYKGIRKCRDTGFSEPNVMFIAPSKWEGVRLLKTADGVYIWGHPSMPGPYTMWGVPVVETTAVTSTKCLLGDYRNFSELSVRRGMDVQVSNSHSTFFASGKLAIRADIRCAVLHYRPLAFCAVTGL
ncbi:phage major capsid protein [Streptomyces sp. OK228]|uniref:phage major capsid protein n=1 Tax=Streptomyces sp. OK228 TaxID=1882786 RepID=UPI000BDCF79A|nr:phage major capsid protein [Streptomyces sp. OK228]SOE25616.1 phage major capsid protein, HK97 family [Streptomyces sp. OK228]